MAEMVLHWDDRTNVVARLTTAPTLAKVVELVQRAMDLIQESGPVAQLHTLEEVAIDFVALNGHRVQGAVRIAGGQGLPSTSPLMPVYVAYAGLKPDARAGEVEYYELYFGADGRLMAAREQRPVVYLAPAGAAPFYGRNGSGRTLDLTPQRGRAAHGW